MQQKYLDQFYDLYEVRWRSMDATAMKWRALRWMSYSAAPTVQFPPAPPQDFHIVKLPLLEEEVRGVLVQHLLVRGAKVEIYVRWRGGAPLAPSALLGVSACCPCVKAPPWSGTRPVLQPQVLLAE